MAVHHGPVLQGGVSIAAGLLAWAMLVACGSEDDQGSAEAARASAAEAWADEVCTSLGDWQQSVTEARDAMDDPRELSVDDVEDIARDVGEATRSVVADLQDVDLAEAAPAPEIEQLLAGLTDQLAHQAELVKDTLGEPHGTVDELLGQVSVVADALATMVADTRTALTGIQEATDDQTVRDAFESSPACQGLGVGALDSD